MSGTSAAVGPGLRLAPSSSPIVSIVMVTYGGWDWPYRSLEALRDATNAPFEAICVDNASWDGTGDLLEELVEGATVVRNAHNAGFAAAANRGAGLARAEHLVFLNPDCLVSEGWLPPLLEAVERPGAGAAIPRFLGEDGRVQEAGSVIDRQGWTEALGRGADTADPAHLFPRVIDYGSAACLVMRRAVFDDVGGFDEEYYPAYCEDVDLCFRLAELGLRTWYQPASSVTHRGSVSTSSVVRDRLIERNRRLLLRRWAHRLEDRPPLSELGERPHRLLALRDALAPDRLLLAGESVPVAGDLLGGLAAEVARDWPEVRVTVLAGRGEPAHVAALALEGVEVALPADPARWLEARRFHYSAAIVANPSLEEPLRRWQPQAERIEPGEGTESGARAVVSRMGVLSLD